LKPATFLKNKQHCLFVISLMLVELLKMFVIPADIDVDLPHARQPARNILTAMTRLDRLNATRPTPAINSEPLSL
jgi:hypothetical protein